MNQKNLLAIAAIAIGCGLLAWILGRQILSVPASDVPSPSPAAAASQKPIAKSLPSSMKAPNTPVHEKAFLEEQLKVNPNHSPILLRLGELERSEGKLPEARRHLEQALRADPTLIDARLELSLVCYQLGDSTEAEKQNLAVLKQDSKQPDALYNLGAIRANQNRFEEARRFWTEAVQYGGDSASAKNAAAALPKLPH